MLPFKRSVCVSLLLSTLWANSVLPISAQEANAQNSNPQESNRTDLPAVVNESGQVVLTEIALDGNKIQANFQWGKDIAVTAVTALVWDGQGNVVDKVEVAVTPGETTTVAFPQDLADPWKTGWSQKITVESSEQQSLAVLPYDISLYCETDEKGEERCQYEVYPGAESDPNVVHLSTDLDMALQEFESQSKDQDILGLIAEKYPELRGETYVYADQLSKLTTTNADCNCHWERAIERDPPAVISMYRTDYLTEMKCDNGLGAAHQLDAYAEHKNFSRVHSISDVVTGKTTVTLRVRCKTVEGPLIKSVWVQGPDGGWYIIEIQYWIIRSCSVGCNVKFDHIGRYSGSATVWTGSGSQRRGNRAKASESGTYLAPGGFSVNTGSDTAPKSFDQTGTGSSSVAAGSMNSGSSAELSTRGYADVVGRAYSARAKLGNSFGIAIHGEAACVSPSEAVTWEVQSYEGRRDEMCQTINNWFGQWSIPPLCKSSPASTWTTWLNRDSPADTGDWETLADFQTAGTNICNGAAPIGINCRTKAGSIDWTATGEVYSCTPNDGGICQNGLQPDGTCLDYEVRFLCQ